MRILPPKLATYDTYVVHVQKRLLVYTQSVYLKRTIIIICSACGGLYTGLELSPRDRLIPLH